MSDPVKSHENVIEGSFAPTKFRSSKQPYLHFSDAPITISPSDARAALENVHGSRTPNKTAIRIYAAAMREGGWIVNGNPLIFDKNGVLLDGFQRLSACVEADKPFKSFIAYNGLPETLHTVDQQRKRNYIGVLEAYGVKHPGTVHRVMGRLIRLENGTYGKSRGQVPWGRFDKVLFANPEIEEGVALSYEFSSRTALKKNARPALAVMALLAGYRQEIRSFLDILQDPDSHEDGPARMLAGIFLSQEAAEGESIKIDQYFAMSIKAFNDHVQGNAKPLFYGWSPDRKLDKDKVKKTIAEKVRKARERGLKVHDKQGNLLAKYKKLTKSEEEACMPRNLGMPEMIGYPGLREARYILEEDQKEFAGAHAEAIKKSAKAGEDETETVVQMTITPEMAEDWLRDFNTRNRKIQRAHVRMIASDITDGYWMVNAQPIGFTGDPETAERRSIMLLNGQHRLKACVESGIPIETFVAKNIPEAAFATYDIHAKKSAAATAISSDDSGKFSNIRADARTLDAAGKFLWRELNGYPLVPESLEDRKRLAKEARDRGEPAPKVVRVPSPSTSQIKKVLEDNLEIVEHHTAARRMKSIGSPAVMLYFLYRIHRERPDLAPDFMESLETGENLSRKNPLLAGRERVFNIRREGTNRNKILMTLLDVWQDYISFKDRENKSQDQPALFH